MRNEAKSGTRVMFRELSRHVGREPLTRSRMARDEWHKEALAEMTPGEFVASLAIMAGVLFLTLAFLWIAEPMRQQAEAQRVEVAR